MRIVFMGSGSFACPVAEALMRSAADTLVAAVTQPDRPSGRNRQVKACPVKELLGGRDMRVLTPAKVGDAAAEIAALKPDLVLVADYGQYIPATILAIPSQRAINVHPSLLPKYRGAAPIQWAIANGETMTGVTVQYVAKKMDSGDILLQQEHEISDADTAATLEPRLAQAGAELALRAIDLIRTGHVHATPQDARHASQARKLAKEDGRIDWSLPAAAIHNRVRAFEPWPGCHALVGGKVLKVLRTRVASVVCRVSRGNIAELGVDGPLVATGDGALQLLEVQPAGRKPMSGADWARGARLEAGHVLG